ncbi:hypothetical protein [Dethiosulfatarculus sandiegensis]|nr:hypothetical protein [Dethiosulfatarculus sandiegensis]
MLPAKYKQEGMLGLALVWLFLDLAAFHDIWRAEPDTSAEWLFLAISLPFWLLLARLFSSLRQRKVQGAETATDSTGRWDQGRR